MSPLALISRIVSWLPSLLWVRFGLLAALLLVTIPPVTASSPTISLNWGHTHSRRQQARYFAIAHRTLLESGSIIVHCDGPVGCRFQRRTLRRLAAWAAEEANGRTITLEPGRGSERSWQRLANSLPGIQLALPTPTNKQDWVAEATPQPESGIHQSVDSATLLADFAAARAAGVRYRFGAKADPQTPPSAIHALDCSGWAGYSLHRASHGAFRLAGLGTAQIARRLRALGVPTCSTAEGARRDGAIRLAVMVAGGRHTYGHCALLLDGATLESSSSSHGVDRKPWTGDGWQRDAVVFVLTPTATI